MIEGLGVKRENYEIVGSYNNQRSQAISPERTVNMFEYIDAKAKRPKVLINTSGLVDMEQTFTGAGVADPFRMQFVFDNAMFSLVGNTLYRQTLAAGELITEIAGTITATTGYVGVDANQTQMIIVDGSNGYIYTTSGGLREITDPGFPGTPDDVCYLDGFFVVINGGTNNFYLSEINNGLIWSAMLTATTYTMAVGSPNMVLTGAATTYLQVGTPFEITVSSGTIALGIYYVLSVVSATTITFSATLGGAVITNDTVGILTGTIIREGELQLGSITSHPGTLVACRTLHRKLFLFSQNYTEVWENQGRGANLPFRRNNSMLMEYGTPSADSVSTGFDLMIFLSQDAGGLGAVMGVSGSGASPLSTAALDYQLSQYAAANQVSDANGMLIKENGLIFYRLSFTEADHTFVYNVSQSTEQDKYWHEEEALNGSRHLAQTHAYFNGVNYVGSYNEPVLYKFDPEWFRNGTEKIRRIRIGRPMMPPGNYRLRVDRFQLDLLQGTVLNLIASDGTYDLLAEDGQVLSTESGLDLLLEQETVSYTQEDLKVWLSMSKDSGQTFGNMIPAPMGEVGERKFVTLWRKLGVVPKNQAFVPRFEFVQDAAFVILSAAWVYEVLPE